MTCILYSPELTFVDSQWFSLFSMFGGAISSFLKGEGKHSRHQSVDGDMFSLPTSHHHACNAEDYIKSARSRNERLFAMALRSPRVTGHSENDEAE